MRGLSVKRRRRDCRSDTFEKLLARSVLAMHEEAAELAKPPDHDVRPTTHCCFVNNSTLNHAVEHHELSKTETQELDHVCNSESS